MNWIVRIICHHIANEDRFLEHWKGYKRENFLTNMASLMGAEAQAAVWIAETKFKFAERRCHLNYM